MTPERQKWWDSLPKEERRVRLAIKKFETDIKWRKKHFSGGLFYTSDQQKSYIAMGKHTIKALRKEIAMDVIALHNSAYEYYTCPYCGQNVREGTGMRDEDRYCASCGQKLRWQE